MPEKEKEEQKDEHLVDNYLRVTGRQGTSPVTFDDLKALMSHEVAPPEEKPAATS